jgi:hypothetical protein
MTGSEGLMLAQLDAGTIGWIVVAVIPNLLIMLWAMARMHRDIRVVAAKLDIVESDNRMLDEGLNQLANEVRDLREQMGPAAELKRASTTQG